MATEKRERKRANRQARLEAAREAQQRARRKRQALRIGIAAAVVLLFVVGFWLLSGDDGDDAASSTTSSTASTTATSETTTTTALPGETLTGPTPCPPVEGATERVARFAEAPPMCIDPAKTYTAVFDTTAGTIRARLDTERTPQTANNFVVLARYKYYDGTRFFRTDTSIGIIQGGGLSNTEDPGYTIPDEGDGTFTYEPGDLVMARTVQPDSAGAQFFFGVNDEVSRLDYDPSKPDSGNGTYVTFGHVTEGLDVLEAILATNEEDPTSGLGGAPDPPVTVNSVRIEES